MVLPDWSVRVVEVAVVATLTIPPSSLPLIVTSFVLVLK